MPPKSRKPSDPATAIDLSAIPEFDRAMRTIITVPKSAVDASIEHERQRKAKKSKRK